MPVYYDIHDLKDRMKKAGATPREILVLHMPCVPNDSLYTFYRDEDSTLEGEYGTREDLTPEEIKAGIAKLFSLFPKKKSIEVKIWW